MRRGVTLCLIAALVLLTAVRGGLHTPTAQGALPAKKVCHTVTKKIHGKKKRVKVCKTVKPTPKPTKTPVPTPTITNRAAALASAVTSASTPDARYAAILNVLKADGVGVRALKDNSIVQAAASARPTGYDLYTYEVHGMAETMDNPQRAVEIADDLSDLGFTTAGGPVTPDGLHADVLAWVQSAAAQPQAASSLIPLVVQDLGLANTTSMDRQTSHAGQQFQLDPVQAFLIEDYYVQQVICPNGCSPTLGRLTASAGSGTNIGNPAGVTPDQYSALMQAQDVFEHIRFQWTANQTQSTHYGPAGHTEGAGEQMQWTVRVATIAMAPDASGGILPPSNGGGPLPGLAYTWQTDGLQYHASQAFPASPSTDASGTADLDFVPKSEIVPGLGTVVSSEGNLFPQFNWNPYVDDVQGMSTTARTWLLHGLNAYFTEDPDEQGDWTVSRHAPAGFKFQGLMVQGQDSDDTGTDPGTEPENDHEGFETFVVSGYVCGEDPYAKPWQLTWDISNSGDDAVPPSDSGPRQHALTLNPDAPAWETDLIPGVTMSLVSLQLMAPSDGSPPKMHAHFDQAQSEWVPVVGDQDVTVTDDTTDCPPPDPDKPGY